MVKNSYVFWPIAFGAVILDQITKFAITSTMTLGQQIQVIPGFFSVKYVQNTGAGFGILQGQNTFLILISLAVIVLMVFWLKKILENTPTTWFAALILGGAIGNLIDRIFYKHVIDFLGFSFWPTFNIADSALTVGVIGLIWISFKEEKKTKK